MTIWDGETELSETVLTFNANRKPPTNFSLITLQGVTVKKNKWSICREGKSEVIKKWTLLVSNYSIIKSGKEIGKKINVEASNKYTTPFKVGKGEAAEPPKCGKNNPSGSCTPVKAKKAKRNMAAALKEGDKDCIPAPKKLCMSKIKEQTPYDLDQIIELYHYTDHSRLKKIKSSGVIKPSWGKHIKKNGVWMTKIKPNDKEEILFNNYKYFDPINSKDQYQLKRAECYIKILVPSVLVEDLSRPPNYPQQDAWIFPDMPLKLKAFKHFFGKTTGPDTNELQQRIVTIADKVFGNTAVQRMAMNHFYRVMKSDIVMYNSKEELEDVGMTLINYYTAAIERRRRR